jgi:hypothetical protein
MTIYKWPQSQICMECQHSEFISSNKRFNSDYICHVNCKKNNGISCPEFIKKEVE